MTVKRFVFNHYGVNTYVVFDQSKQCIIIDSACNSESEEHTLIEFIASEELTPIMAINTHAHIDHIVGCNFVCKHYNIPWYLHAEDVYNIERSLEYGSSLGFHLIPPPAPQALGEEVCFGNSKFKVLSTPGHTKGGVCFYNAEEHIVFTGDTLFKSSIGRTDLPGGNLDSLMESITTKLLTLPDDTEVCAGHGAKSSIGDEKLHNPFLLPPSLEQL
ncbi:MAG: MBL fold metallo-hydrolase [Bacteroidales bacterium]